MPSIPARWPPVHLGKQIGQGIPIFNRWHWMSTGCIAAYIPAAFPGGLIPNLVTPGLGDLTTRAGTGVNMGMTPDGLGIAYSGTAAQSVTGPTPSSSTWRGTVDFSLFARGLKIGTATNNHPSNIIGVNSSSSPFNCYAMGFGGTAAGGGGAITAYQTSVSAAQTGSIVPPVGLMFDALLSLPPGANAARLWINGVEDVVATPATVNIVYNGTVTTNLGLGGTNNPVEATITAGYIWNPRLMQKTDAVYLHENPYCLFLWESDLMMSELVGVTPTPPAPTTNKSLILSPLTIGLGGAAAAERWLARRKVQMRRLRGE